MVKCLYPGTSLTPRGHRKRAVVVPSPHISACPPRRTSIFPNLYSARRMLTLPWGGALWAEQGSVSRASAAGDWRVCRAATHSCAVSFTNHKSAASLPTFSRFHLGDAAEDAEPAHPAGCSLRGSRCGCAE